MRTATFVLTRGYSPSSFQDFEFVAGAKISWGPKDGIRKKFEEWAADTNFQEEITPKMTKEEKDRALYRLIYGKEKEEMEREKAEAKKKKGVVENKGTKGDGGGENCSRSTESGGADLN